MNREPRTMQVADAATASRAPENTPAMVKKIGKTTYKVHVHFSNKTPDPVEDTEPKTADTAVTESDESDAAKILELLKNPETAALLKQLAKAL